MSGEAEHEIYKRRRGRLAVTAIVLGALAALIFAVTIVKLQGAAVNPFAAIFNPQAQQAAQP